jgi:hypothetical protein
MSTRGRFFVGLALAAACGGCGGVDAPVTAPDDSPGAATVEASWGETALAWVGALEEAAMNGTDHLEPFLAADLVWEDRVGAEFIQGRDSWMDAYLTGDLHSIFLPMGAATYFVSADEVVGQRVVEYDVPISWLDRMEIGPDGMHHWVRAGSIEAGRHYEPWRLDFDTYDDVADKYVALWNGSDDLDAGSLYESDAVISDSVLGDSVAGLSAIEQTLETGSWPSIGNISIADLLDGGGRAVHIAASDEDWMGPEELGLMIEADDGSGCPGSMVVILGLDGELVSSEQRYHNIESVRRCEEPAMLLPGWWDEIEVPAPMVVELTGTVSFGDMEIDVFNGTEAMHAFLEWGLERFEIAGLEVPQVDSVTFLEASAYCYNLGGEAASTDQGATVILCRTADDICVDEPCRQWRDRDRQLWLHELAHPWLEAHTDDSIRADYLELVGLQRWSDPQDPWEERGVEIAAETIAYGLMDEPIERHPEFDADRAERFDGFRILTGSDPICAESDP